MAAPQPIRDAAGVEQVAASARAAGRMALDFEFLWERTYAPVPCLAQVNVAGEISLIDPVEGAPLEPLAELMADPGVTVVMHAPSADLTLMALSTGVAPTRLVDVQVTAGFVGLGAGQGLSALLERVLRVPLDKGERFTDWSRRPLSAAQSAYAAADVAHLLELSDRLDERAERLGRTDWVAEEHARRYGPGARFVTAPEDAWRRVKGQGRLNARDRAVLAELAAWREREARSADRPTSWVMPDRTLVELAKRKPSSRRALENERGIPDRIRGAELDGVMDALRRGAEAGPIAMPPAPPPELQIRSEILAPLASALVSARAEAAELAPSLLATRDDIGRYLVACMSGDPDGEPLASGWRHQLAGRALADMVAGRIALAAIPQRPYLAEIPRDPSAGAG